MSEKTTGTSTAGALVAFLQLELGTNTHFLLGIHDVSLWTGAATIASGPAKVLYADAAPLRIRGRWCWDRSIDGRPKPKSWGRGWRKGRLLRQDIEAQCCSSRHTCLCCRIFCFAGLHWHWRWSRQIGRGSFFFVCFFFLLLLILVLLLGFLFLDLLFCSLCFFAFFLLVLGCLFGILLLGFLLSPPLVLLINNLNHRRLTASLALGACVSFGFHFFDRLW
mmetsp:Transcript_45509/g.99119  ORF Transcript_45509/g.99119 Transcript_45509/m.99119 type:complete len:221 (+) Transcript_45509:129-791(+)